MATNFPNSSIASIAAPSRCSKSIPAETAIASQGVFSRAHTSNEARFAKKDSTTGSRDKYIANSTGFRLRLLSLNRGVIWGTLAISSVETPNFLSALAFRAALVKLISCLRGLSRPFIELMFPVFDLATSPLILDRPARYGLKQYETKNRLTGRVLGGATSLASSPGLPVRPIARFHAAASNSACSRVRDHQARQHTQGKSIRFRWISHVTRPS